MEVVALSRGSAVDVGVEDAGAVAEVKATTNRISDKAVAGVVVSLVAAIAQ
jgi:hypothetical protein